MPQIAIAKTFLDSFARLPKAQQRSARAFLDKFQKNPESPGINFERLTDARDQKVRSVRIDKAYRAIVVHPPKGDIYLCVWVDQHDDAYSWVRMKRFDVNPRSGVLQIYDVEEESEGAPEARSELAETPRHAQLSRSAEPPTTDRSPRFSQLSDEDLLRAGVPEPVLGVVRAIVTDDDLDREAPRLPPDAANVLYALAAGYSLSEALSDAGRTTSLPRDVNTDDFQTALERPESRELFAVVAGETELEVILDAPLEQWRIFLHPSQSRLVRINANGPVRVLGAAGTGKTVVLMHRANFLLNQVFTGPDDRVLVTTFTRNLAQNLLQNLRALCGESASRLAVLNLHAWAHQFLQQHGRELAVINDARRDSLFEKAYSQGGPAINLPLAFYREEWDRIVQPQDIGSRSEYLAARRVGRGTRLSRAQRADIWTVFERYRALLEKERRVEWADVVREARLLLETGRVQRPYRAVLADEVQDFTAGDLRLLRAIAPEGPNSLFVVGDGHQRIYGQPERLGACGIDIRGRSRRLKLNYRTTEQISRQAVAVLKNIEIDDLDGGQDTLTGYVSLRRGPRPLIRQFKLEADEGLFLVDTIRQWITNGVNPAAICLAARTNSQINTRYAPLLEAAGIAVVKVRRDPQGEAERPGVRLATMHRLKGLEYSRVLLAGVQDGKVPLAQPDLADHASFEDHDRQERCLFYVASTRARDELVISGFGYPSPYLSK